MNLVIADDAAALAARAAEFIITAAQEAVDARGRFTIALTGGGTPEDTYKRLGKPEQASRVDWDKVFVFWGDERFVSPEDSRSNYGMAWRSLIEQVPLADANIFPMPVQAENPEHGAELYADTMREFFDVPMGGPPPQFDLILLGLGGDGHVASLFPGFPTLDVTDRWVVASPPGTLPPPVDRITMTFPVLNAARCVAFLVGGEGKAEIVQAVLEGNSPREVHPVRGVLPTSGELTWLLDKPAARLLAQPQGGS